ncbi:secretin N-terminal domain-containing protein [Roseiconus nitratireducens]|nr:secretin N-terminal domain-containing protein [Roseiconus nitratireducens]
MRNRRVLVGILAIFVISVLPSWTALGQRPAGPSRPAADDEIVELNLSGTVKVTTLLDLMSQQLDVRFLHGTDVARREVTVYTPARLPKKVLPTLLGSLLREAKLAVVDSEVAGWKRVVDIGEIVSNAPAGEAAEISRRNGPAAAVTQVIPVKFVDVTTASTSLQPFLDRDGSNIVALPDQNLLIISGYAAEVQQVVDLLAMIDRPDEKGVIEFYQARQRPPEMLIEQYQSIQQDDAAKNAAKKSTGIQLMVDKTGRRVVVAGRKELVDGALETLRKLDSGSRFLTRVYRLEYIGAARLDHLIGGFIETGGEQDASAVETTIDEEGNLLVVRAGAETHRQIELLIEELDQPVDSEASPIRFYKLKNATAIEVLYSLLALQQAAGSGVTQAGGLMPGAFGTLDGMNVGGIVPMGFAGGANAFGAAGDSGVVDLPLAGRPMIAGGSRLGEQLREGNMTPMRRENQNAALGPLVGAGVDPRSAGFAGGFAGAGFAGPGYGGFGGYGGATGAGVAMLPGGARISADVATNSLIVFAPSNVQSLYEKLIRSLDQRRPQVLIEADIIAIDTSDNFSLGVEVSIGDREGSTKLFKFTSFGLSEVDPVNGALTINPALGFNGVLVDPEIADVIVQALSRHRRGRVLSSPKILVNDNQTGSLESVASVPFQSVNAADTIATTSLGGNQQAGTIIQVTPHINEDDHLQLEFDVEFSTFVGSGSDALPPPRQIDRVGSVVTIPDGKTVVVGGLKRTNDGKSFTGVPWLEKIPIVRDLTSLQTGEQSTTSFFLFIRPKILRDSRFRDLQFLSDLETHDAQFPADYPVSGPLLIPCPDPSATTPRGGQAFDPSTGWQADPHPAAGRNAWQVLPQGEIQGHPELIHPAEIAEEPPAWP